MPWLWKTVSNPAANSVVYYLTGHPNFGYFSIHGLYISHSATAIKRYTIRTALRNADDSGYQETKTIFGVALSGGTPFILISEDHPIVPQIGRGAYVVRKERIEIIAIDGGEPTLNLGMYYKGTIYEADNVSL